MLLDRYARKNAFISNLSVSMAHIVRVVFVLYFKWPLWSLFSIVILLVLFIQVPLFSMWKLDVFVHVSNNAQSIRLTHTPIFKHCMYTVIRSSILYNIAWPSTSNTIINRTSITRKRQHIWCIKARHTCTTSGPVCRHIVIFSSFDFQLLRERESEKGLVLSLASLNVYTAWKPNSDL